MSFVGKDNQTSYEKAREQSRTIIRLVREGKRQLQRQIYQSDQELQRLSNDIRKHVPNNNKVATRSSIKAFLKIKRDKIRLSPAIASLDTIEKAIQSQLRNVRLTGEIQKSADIAHALSKLMEVEQFQAVSEQLTKELIRMGYIDDMINEAVNALMDNDDLEEEIDEEVDHILENMFPKPNLLPPVPDNGPVRIPIPDGLDEEDALEKHLDALRH